MTTHHRLSVRQLESIVAVADAMSFRRAAERLGIAQPVLSTHIASAETELKVQLFERDRRSVLVTALGHEVVKQARLALAAIDQVASVVAANNEPLAGTLRMGVIPTIAPYWLPTLLPHVRAQFPKLALLLREEQTANLIEHLSAGELDVALLALPIAGDFTAMEVCKEAFVYAEPRRAKQREAKPTMKAHELEGQTMLLLEDGHCLRDQALAICSQQGAVESLSMRATSLLTLTQMVAGGLGATLLPEASLASLSTATRALLQLRRFTAPEPTRTLGLLWRTSSARLKEFRLLGTALQAAAAEVLASVQQRNRSKRIDA